MKVLEVNSTAVNLIFSQEVFQMAKGSSSMEHPLIWIQSSKTTYSFLIVKGIFMEKAYISLSSPPPPKYTGSTCCCAG